MQMLISMRNNQKIFSKIEKRFQIFETAFFVIISQGIGTCTNLGSFSAFRSRFFCQRFSPSKKELHSSRAAASQD